MLRSYRQGPSVISGFAPDYAFLISGPEHIAPWIEHVYGMYEWKQLPGAKLAWLHESMNRDDFKIDFDSIKWVADQWFFPAIQDAEKHDQEMFKKDHSHYLPFGVDEGIFKPRLVSADNIECASKEFDVAFMGMMYPKRTAWLNSKTTATAMYLRVTPTCTHN